MRRIFLILWMCFVIGFVGFIGYQANTARACYVVAQQDLDDISFRASQNVGYKRTQCTGEYTVIQSLEACIDRVHEKTPSVIKTYMATLTARVTGFMRYGGKDLATLQNIHDLECSEYPATLFVPPELGL